MLGPWTWESCSLIFSIGLLVAIYTILDHANNRPVEDWNFIINVNSLVAIISTVLRGVIVAIAAEIIAQQKWNSFWSSTSEPQPLAYFEQFDQGSRGIWGAACLLPIVIRRNFVSVLAVLIVLVSFAVGPFVQQAINTVQRDVLLPQGTASLPIAQRVNASTTYYRSLAGSLLGMWEFSYDTRSDLYTSILNPGGNESTIYPDCPTANCTFQSWPVDNGSDEAPRFTHSSIGICSACTDLKDLITVYHPNGSLSSYPRAKLPNGLEVNTFDSAPSMQIRGNGNLTWAEKAIPPSKAAQFHYSQANVTVFTITGNGVEDGPQVIPNSNFVAVSCSLYPCLRYYSAVVDKGQLKEEVVHTEHLQPDLSLWQGDAAAFQPDNPTASTPGFSMWLSGVQSPCFNQSTGALYTSANMSEAEGGVPLAMKNPNGAPELLNTTAPSECVYKMTLFFNMYLRQILTEELFNGTCYWDSRQGVEINCGKSWWLSQFWETQNATATSIIDRFTIIADSLTNRLRLGLGRDDTSVNKVLGTAIEPKAYTVVEWQWLLFPTLVLFIELLILIWMMIRSWRHRDNEVVWKSSVLAMFFYRDSFEPVDNRDLSEFLKQEKPRDGSLLTAREMSSKATEVKVKFGFGHDAAASGAEHINYGYEQHERKRASPSTDMS